METTSRLLPLICAVFFSQPAAAFSGSDLAALIDTTPAGGTLTLTAGIYDSDAPILIRKDLEITGPATATVQAELQIIGVTVHIVGVTLHQIPRVAATNPDIAPWMYQDAQIAVRTGGQIWIDDLTADAAPGSAKSFIYSATGSVFIRAVHKPTIISYLAVPAITIKAWYNSYLMLISFTQNGTNTRVTVYTNGQNAGVYVVSSQITMLSATIVSTTAGGTQCLSLSRAAIATVHGTSAFYNCAIGVSYEHAAQAWIDGTVTYYQVPEKWHHWIFTAEQTLR